MHPGEPGATEDMLDGIADGTIITEGGYKVLNRDEVSIFMCFYIQCRLP